MTAINYYENKTDHAGGLDSELVFRIGNSHLVGITIVCFELVQRLGEGYQSSPLFHQSACTISSEQNRP